MKRQSSQEIDPTKTNQSSDKLLGLLEMMSTQPEPLRLQEIASLANMNSTTALRFLTALQRRNYVAQEENGGRYFLTHKICVLARNVTANMGIRKIALPFLRELAYEFSESCYLAVEEEMSVVYVEVESYGNQVLTSTQRIGHVAPLHCTGVGKLFLSEYTTEELARYIDRKGLTSFTSNTITTKDGLLSELKKIKANGYAVDDEECDEGVRCFAVPIWACDGTIAAGISVSGPSVRVTDELICSRLSFLLSISQKISMRLGRSD